MNKDPPDELTLIYLIELLVSMSWLSQVTKRASQSQLLLDDLHRSSHYFQADLHVVPMQRIGFLRGVVQDSAQHGIAHAQPLPDPGFLHCSIVRRS